MANYFYERNETALRLLVLDPSKAIGDEALQKIGLNKDELVFVDPEEIESNDMSTRRLSTARPVSGAISKEITIRPFLNDEEEDDIAVKEPVVKLLVVDDLIADFKVMARPGIIFGIFVFA